MKNCDNKTIAAVYNHAVCLAVAKSTNKKVKFEFLFSSEQEDVNNPARSELVSPGFLLQG